MSGGDPTLRHASAQDAAAIAALHAESWRRHYRGAFSDEYLDGPVWADRLQVWTDRLAHPQPGRCTLVADQDGAVVGLAHTVFDDDPAWGALLDNLHVAQHLQRAGVGTQLMAESARRLMAHDPTMPLYLWVLEQNTRAQAFYAALGGRCVERQSRAPDPGERLRIAWPEPSALLRPA